MKFEDFEIIRESDHFTAFEINDIRTLVDEIDLLEILLLNGYKFTFKTHIINHLFRVVCRDLHKPDPNFSLHKGVRK